MVEDWRGGWAVMGTWRGIVVLLVSVVVVVVGVEHAWVVVEGWGDVWNGCALVI